ncbi:DnaB helicase-like protein [Rhizobium sp. PP-CC-3A-592]|nr:DnaB helicase-like protein [Rhizobium sp. PP-CC-3A-592]
MKLSMPIHSLKRRAKSLARDEDIALHAALDKIAREEGFPRWGLLSARLGASGPARKILPALRGGDLLLLGARPGQGKTSLGLQLLLEASKVGRRSVFFTLEYTAGETRERLASLQGPESEPRQDAEVFASDDICADFIIGHLRNAASGTIAVIDYLQILDQNRSSPEISIQMRLLQSFASGAGVTLAFISQIDRSYDPKLKPLPDIQDIRLPNPFDTGIFSKTCFLNGGNALFRDNL